MTREATQSNDSESERFDDEDRGSGAIEERVAHVTEALAPIILPMIESLASIDTTEADSATASGEAT
jgi:hypothetical protein